MTEVLDRETLYDPENGANLLDRNESLIRRIRSLSSVLEELEESKEGGEHSYEENFAKSLIGLLSSRSPRGAKYETMSQELSALSKFVTSTIEAVESGILSKSEAESLISHVLANFATRRVDEIVDNLFTTPHSRWFLAASKHFHGKGE